jgi:urea transport system permease protein
MIRRIFLSAAFALTSFLFTALAHALDPAMVAKLTSGESDDQVAAVAALVASGEERAIVLLQALSDGNVQVAGKQVLIVKGEDAVDAVTGARVAPLPPGLEDVGVNNRLRRELESGIAALQLISSDRTVRLAAIKELGANANDAMLPLVNKALAKETDPDIKAQLEMIAAAMELKGGTKESRIAALKKLASSNNPNTKTLLLGVLEKGAEADEDVRREAETSLRSVEGRLAWASRAGLLFSGISLGSILLLAALGLAITYGLMGVINMAHGELIMIGAYTTYVVQNLFRAYAPGAFDWYLALAVPASFVVAGAVGMALERSVIRWLYGRPLETLLATFGLSLILQQVVRDIFTANNRPVESPSWMAGSLQVNDALSITYNRLVIVLFTVAVFFVLQLVLKRTRLGLEVRAVAQNRAMAKAMGVRTDWVDALTFGLGSGIAGVAGVALSQLTNVGPNLGQQYIVDSFMVVVFGGVGNLWGTLIGGMSLGVINKILEPYAGAVLGKIIVLVCLILFIQRRPRGLFPQKGRAAEA